MINKKYLKHTIKSRSAILAICGVLLLAILLLGVLEKTHVTNFFASPSSDKTKTSSEELKVNDVNYDPPTSEEKDLADQIKSEAQQNSEGSPSTTDTVSISLSAATQDEPGGPVVVRAIVSAQSGNCSITLSGSNYTKNFSSAIENLGNYYGCGLNIPIADVPAGSYTLKLSVTSGSATGSVSQKVEIRK